MAKPIKKQKRVLKIIKNYKTAYFKDIQTVTGYTSCSIRNILAALHKKGCIKRTKTKTRSNICIYEYLRDIEDERPIANDFAEHYQIMNRMIASGQMQTSVQNSI